MYDDIYFFKIAGDPHCECIDRERVLQVPIMQLSR